MSAPRKTPRLDRRMVLEAPARVADGAGGFQLTWVVRGVLWAALTPGAGREAAGVEVRAAQVPYRITVRGAPDGAPARPLPGQRFRDATRVFAITAVTERDAGGRYLTCFATEEVRT